jgi:hypothetical protein
MKNISYILVLLVASFTVFSCEEVVDVDLETTTPKLVIDASIKWQKGSDGSSQKIILTTTTDYYATTIPVASGATVSVTNNSATTPVNYQFLEIGQTGEYICSNFKPVINDNYTLTVVYKGQTYTANSQLTATPDIVKVEQKLKPGFGGEDVYEIKYYFQDNPNENNFYLGGIKNSTITYPEYGVISDEFTQGNLMFVVYQEELKKGDIVDYTLQGITEKYNNYMYKLISTTGVEGNGPFAVPQASAIRGNIINQTNAENFPLGYFQLSEMDSGSLIIQ